MSSRVLNNLPISEHSKNIEYDMVRASRDNIMLVK